MKTGKAIKYTITIEPSFNNGFIVSVGCAKIPFESHNSLVEGLRYYLEDPEKVEAEYNKLFCPPSEAQQDFVRQQRQQANPLTSTFGALGYGTFL